MWGVLRKIRHEALAHETLVITETRSSGSSKLRNILRSCNVRSASHGQIQTEGFRAEYTPAQVMGQTKQRRGLEPGGVDGSKEQGDSQEMRKI